MNTLLRAVLLAGGLVHAAITSPSGAAVLVSMQGTAGLHIEGTTHELAISERDGELVFQVPLAGVDTGIGLRNRHMRGYLDTAHFPDAELHVARKAVGLPRPGEDDGIRRAGQPHDPWRLQALLHPLPGGAGRVG